MNSEELKKYNFIFISIPKTATNSIWSTFQKGKIRPFQHTKAKTIKNLVDDNTWNKFKFACVRNPYDLIKSWYFYHKYHDNLDQETKDFYPDSFKEWVMNQSFKTHWELKDHQIKNPFWDGTNPLFQYEWVYDDNENKLVDYIVYYENLQNDFQYIADRFNLSNNLQILNSSSYTQEEYDEEMKEKVAQIFDKDFKLLNYSK